MHVHRRLAALLTAALAVTLTTGALSAAPVHAEPGGSTAVYGTVFAPAPVSGELGYAVGTRVYTDGGGDRTSTVVDISGMFFLQLHQGTHTLHFVHPDDDMWGPEELTVAVGADAIWGVGMLLRYADPPTYKQAPTVAAPQGYEVGGYLRADPGTWSVWGLSFDYVWNRDGKPIGAPNEGTYRLRAADVGHDVSVTVTTRDPRYRDAVYTTRSRRVDKTTVNFVWRKPGVSDRVYVGQRPAFAVSVNTGTRLRPTGRVKVFMGGKLIASARPNRKGMVTGRLLRLGRPGPHQVVVKYGGDRGVASGKLVRTVTATQR